MASCHVTQVGSTITRMCKPSPQIPKKPFSPMLWKQHSTRHALYLMPFPQDAKLPVPVEPCLCRCPHSPCCSQGSEETRVISALSSRLARDLWPWRVHTYHITTQGPWPGPMLQYGGLHPMLLCFVHLVGDLHRFW